MYGSMPGSLPNSCAYCDSLTPDRLTAARVAEGCRIPHDTVFVFVIPGAIQRVSHGSHKLPATLNRGNWVSVSRVITYFETAVFPTTAEKRSPGAAAQKGIQILAESLAFAHNPSKSSHWDSAARAMEQEERAPLALLYFSFSSSILFRANFKSGSSSGIISSRASLKNQSAGQSGPPIGIENLHFGLLTDFHGRARGDASGG